MTSIDEDISDPSYGALVQGEPYYPPYTMASVLDLPALRSKDCKSPGLYFGISREDPTRPWVGASLHITKDPAKTQMFAVVPFGIETSVGYASTTLASGPVGYWDRLNSITVEMFQGELESRPPEDVLEGANFAILGNEIIAYLDAVLIDENTYELTNLLRGLRDTEDAIGSHGSNERFVPLNMSNIRFMDFDTLEIGAPRYFKAVPAGGLLADSIQRSHTVSGNTLKPFSPCHIEGSRDGSNNLTISWTRRTRDLVRVLSGLPIPLLEEKEEYQIDVIDGVDVVRTIVATTTSTTYSAANQTTDGLTPGDPVTVDIYQMSTVVGRGKKRRATV